MRRVRRFFHIFLSFILAATMLFAGVSSAGAMPVAPEANPSSGLSNLDGDSMTGASGGFSDPLPYVDGQIIVTFDSDWKLDEKIEDLKADIDALAETIILEELATLAASQTASLATSQIPVLATSFLAILDLEDDPPVISKETEVEVIASGADSGSIAVVELPDEVDVADAIVEALKNPSVISASPNYLLYLIDDDPVDDAFLSALSSTIDELADINDPYYVNNTQYNLDLVNAPLAWDSVQVNHSVTVAVVDTGVRMTHEDLAANIDTVHAWDIVNGQSLAASVAQGLIGYGGDIQSTGSSTGHGTHVSGIVSAIANNELGIAGVSYNAIILPVQIFYLADDGINYTSRTSTLISAYDYLIGLKVSGAVPNLRVINLSLGGYTPPSSNDPLQAKIREAEQRGILTVAAAGNSGTNPTYLLPNGLNMPIYPADFPEVVAVTAVNSNSEFYTSSDHNEFKDICAPGVGIISTMYSADNAYGYKTGTSMASPVVAACAALLWAANPRLSVAQVKSVLFSTAKDLGDTGKDPYYGWGLVDIAAAVEDVLSIRNGWYTDAGMRWYYEDDVFIIGSKYIDGHWYRFDLRDGHMLVGSQKIDGEWYRYDLVHGYMLFGDQQIDGRWYRYHPTLGHMLFGSQKVDGNWYWYDLNNGYKLYGSQKIYGDWYRYDLNDGHMLFGSQKIDGNWYWYDFNNGYMVFGSQKINGEWYRYSLYNGAMLFGSQYIDGSWYWYDLNNGYMLFGWLNVYGSMQYYDYATGRRLV